MKHALITGSTKGIGYAIGEKLVKNSWYVFFNYAHDDSFDIRLPSENHTIIKADLSHMNATETLANAVLKTTDTLDCLVLNAGITCRKPIKDITYRDWQHVMDVNINAPFFLVQRLFDHIADNGSVIFISSSLSIKPHATSIPYGVSKAAVNMLAQNLVKDFAPRGIRVNVICPGFIDTEWQIDKTEELRAKIESKIALRRFGNPNAVADACWSLIENQYINGAILSVDGGYDME